MTALNIKELQPRLRSAWLEWKELDTTLEFEPWVTQTYGVNYEFPSSRNSIKSAWVENEKKYMLFLINHGDGR